MTWLKVTGTAVLGTRFELLRGPRYSGAYGERYTGHKWRCAVCGREGYGDADGPSPRDGWASACRRGHAPCDYCGRMLPLLMSGQARTHSRCPNRPGGNR